MKRIIANRVLTSEGELRNAVVEFADDDEVTNIFLMDGVQVEPAATVFRPGRMTREDGGEIFVGYRGKIKIQ